MQRTKKSYNFTGEEPMTVNEPALIYDSPVADVSISDKWADYCTNGAVPNTHPSTFGEWNPNVPFHCTQEEFLDRIRSIEQGNFTPLEEANREFEQWKRKFLASQLN